MVCVCEGTIWLSNDRLDARKFCWSVRIMALDSKVNIRSNKDECGILVLILIQLHWGRAYTVLYRDGFVCVCMCVCIHVIIIKLKCYWGISWNENMIGQRLEVFAALMLWAATKDELLSQYHAQFATVSSPTENFWWKRICICIYYCPMVGRGSQGKTKFRVSKLNTLSKTSKSKTI